jgi:hypothetical protein
VKNLVNAAARVASVFQITHLDINNEVRRIKSKPEAALTMQREVSLSELFALLAPSTTITACSASDTLSSMLSNVEEDTIQELVNKTPSSGLLASSGLNLLASVAAKSNYPQLPNRCSYPGCGAPICLVPLDCSTPNCTGKVHPFCQVFASASGCTMFPQPSKVKCQQCISPEPNLFAHGVKSSQAQVVNSDCHISCALDQEEDAYGNEGTVPVEQVSQVSQDKEVNTDQVPMVEGLHSRDREGAPDQA